MVESDGQIELSREAGREFAITCESPRLNYRCERERERESAVTRPFVKVFLVMVDTSLKFLVPFSFSCYLLRHPRPARTKHGVYNKVHVEEIPKVVR